MGLDGVGTGVGRHLELGLGRSGSWREWKLQFGGAVSRGWVIVGDDNWMRWKSGVGGWGWFEAANPMERLTVAVFL